MAVGAITNIASALLLAPEIVAHIVVVWLGGQPFYWPTAKEFNLQQDVPAAQVVFDSGVPLVHVPCKNVAEHLRTTLPEMQAYWGKGVGGETVTRSMRLHGRARRHAPRRSSGISAPSPRSNDPTWVPTRWYPSPCCETTLVGDHYDDTRHTIRVATELAIAIAIYGEISFRNCTVVHALASRHEPRDRPRPGRARLPPPFPPGSSYSSSDGGRRATAGEGQRVGPTHTSVRKRYLGPEPCVPSLSADIEAWGTPLAFRAQRIVAPVSPARAPPTERPRQVGVTGSRAYSGLHSPRAP